MLDDHPAPHLRPPKWPLEVPIFGPGNGALVAHRGAGRIELNHAGSYALGGTTPTVAELAELRHNLDAIGGLENVAVRVMVRPRGPPDADSAAAAAAVAVAAAAAPSAPAPPPPPTARRQDFVYSDAEFAAMRDAVEQFAASGLLHPGRGDGFVFGVLKRDGGGRRVRVDVERNAALVRLAGPFRCVFHRAFDDLVDADGGASPMPEARRAVADVAACGFDGLLTSGGRGNAVGNLDALRRLAELIAEAGAGLQMIVGGGLRAGHVRRIFTWPKADWPGEGWDVYWAHSSCLVGGNGEGGEEVLDGCEVSRLVEELRENTRFDARPEN